MIKKKCLVCSKIYYTLNKKAKYCSRKCLYIRLKEPKIRKKCLICKKTFYVQLSLDRCKFCSHKCYWKWKVGKPGPKTKFKKGEKRITGKNSYSWKGGKTTHNAGYIVLRFTALSKKEQKLFKSMFNKNKNCLEHRIIAARCFNRPLIAKESIHHINNNKSDNRPENLYLFDSESKHQIFEQSKNKPKLTSNLPNSRI